MISDNENDMKNAINRTTTKNWPPIKENIIFGTLCIYELPIVERKTTI